MTPDPASTLLTGLWFLFSLGNLGIIQSLQSQGILFFKSLASGSWKVEVHSGEGGGNNGICILLVFLFRNAILAEILPLPAHSTLKQHSTKIY